MSHTGSPVADRIVTGTVPIEDVRKQTFSTKKCECGCGAIFTPTGPRCKYIPGHSPSQRAIKARTALSTKRPAGGWSARKPTAALTKVQEVAASERKMVQIAMPEDVVDKIIALMPTKVKVAAMENILAQM